MKLMHHTPLLKRLVFSTWQRLLLCVMVLFCCFNVVAATDSLYNSMSAMPVKIMKNAFNKKNAAYRYKVSKEVEKNVDLLCKVLADTAMYDAQLQKQIATLNDKLAEAETPQQKYELWALLYNHYSHLSFRPALVAAQNCEQLAHQIGDYNMEAQAIINKANIYVKCGFFREASEALAMVDMSRCSRSVKINYLLAGFNLEFENGFYFPRHMLKTNIYKERMQAYYMQLKPLLPNGSWIIDDLEVKLNFNKRQYAEAVACSKRLLKKLSPENSYYANAVGNMGYNYMGLGDYANASRYITLSGIAEIKQGSKEYAAARKIAEVAYITGDIARSYMLINVAIHNAETFHSRYRYAEIATSYPKIDNDMYAYTQQQKQRLTIGFVFLLFVVLLLCGAIVMMMRQRKKLHHQKTLIEKQVQSISDKTKQIEDINAQLLEAGHIKEVVLGQLIVASANHQSAMDKLRKEVLRRLTIKDYDGLRNVFDRQQGEAFDTLYPIDQILLTLFPDFPEQFNSLLRPENRVAPRRDERFTTEMRIFALIRLGITKNDDLARSLNYSVNTVKSYKTRVLNASLYDKEEFYKRLKNSHD